MCAGSAPQHLAKIPVGQRELEGVRNDNSIFVVHNHEPRSVMQSTFARVGEFPPCFGAKLHKETVCCFWCDYLRDCQRFKSPIDILEGIASLRMFKQCNKPRINDVRWGWTCRHKAFGRNVVYRFYLYMRACEIYVRRT